MHSSCLLGSSWSGGGKELFRRDLNIKKNTFEAYSWRKDGMLHLYVKWDSMINQDFASTPTILELLQPLLVTIIDTQKAK